MLEEKNNKNIEKNSKIISMCTLKNGMIISRINIVCCSILFIVEIYLYFKTAFNSSDEVGGWFLILWPLLIGMMVLRMFQIIFVYFFQDYLIQKRKRYFQYVL